MERDNQLEEEPHGAPARRPDAGDFDPALTPPAMATLLRGDGDRVAAAAQRLSQARQQFETATDRSRFGTDAGHAGAVAEAEPALRQAERAVAAVAEAAAANARQTLAQLAGSATPTLAPADAPTAAALAGFVKEDCADLPIGELVARVRAAVVAENRPLMWLYQRYGAPRATAAASDDDQPGTDTSRRELGALLRAIRDRLRDQANDPLRERANGGLRDAQKLRASAAAPARQRDAEAAIARMIPNAVRIPD